METKDKTKEELLAELDSLYKKFALSNSKIQKEIQKQKGAKVLSEKNEYRFREVLENSIGASYKRDLKTNSYEYLSPVFTKITGYTPEEMMTLPLETILGLIHPDDIPIINNIIQKSLTPPFGNSYKIEYRFKDKRNRDYQWLCDQYRVMLDSEGKPTAFIGSVSDISERKEYEKKLIESNERLQSIFNNLQDAYFEEDSTGKFTTVSPVALKMYGYSSVEEIVGLPASSLYANITDRENLIKILSKEGRVIDFTCQGMRKDKSTFWVSMNSHLKYDKNGQFAGTVGVVRDITDRKENENKIKQSEENYRNIYDNAIEGMYRTSIEGKTIQCNNALAHILGYESAEEVITSLNDLAHQTWLNASDRLKLAELLDNQGIVSGYETQFKKKCGEIIWVSMNIKLIRDTDGEKLYYDGFLEEITDRKNKEFEIQKKMKTYSGILTSQ